MVRTVTNIQRSKVKTELSLCLRKGAAAASVMVVAYKKYVYTIFLATGWCVTVKASAGIIAAGISYWLLYYFESIAKVELLVSPMVSRHFNVALLADAVCYESLLAINHLDVCSNGELYHLLGDRKRREEQQQFVVLEDPISITLIQRGRKRFQQLGLNAVIM
jgi:hypothetical protein